MNKDEKELAKKILAYYYSQSKIASDFTREENMILERWRVHKIINDDAFKDLTGFGDNHKIYAQGQSYPFTPFGDDEIKKNWYLSFRDSKGVIIIRDILTVVAFLVSLYLAIKEIFQ
jgi:hypothetical protein